jgi:hypothetical protein
MVAGTWSKTSTVVGGRRPLARDAAQLQYDVDSDDEWEEEEVGERYEHHSVTHSERERERERKRERETHTHAYTHSLTRTHMLPSHPLRDTFVWYGVGQSHGQRWRG